MHGTRTIKEDVLLCEQEGPCDDFIARALTNSKNINQSVVIINSVILNPLILLTDRQTESPMMIFITTTLTNQLSLSTM